jgi:hypothetical protein
MSRAVRLFYGDLWTLYDQGLFVVDPTNAYVKADGRNVMGAGVSRQVMTRWPTEPAWYGARLLAEVRPGRPAGAPVEAGDLAERLLVVDDEHRLLFAPVKLNWWQPADLALIERSLAELGDWLSAHPKTEIALPRLGCGNGGRDWASEVRPLFVSWLQRLADPVHARVVLLVPATKGRTAVTAPSSADPAKYYEGERPAGMLPGVPWVSPLRAGSRPGQ